MYRLVFHKNLICVFPCHPPDDFQMKFSNRSKQASRLSFSFAPYCVNGPERKQIYFFLLKRGIHISHRTPIIGSNRGLTTLGMPLKSWESHEQKEVISNIFLWSTLYSCCMWVSSNHTHTHTQIALIKVPHIHLHLVNSWVVSETLKYIDLLRP